MSGGCPPSAVWSRVRARLLLKVLEVDAGFVAKDLAGDSLPQVGGPLGRDEESGRNAGHEAGG